MGQELRPYQQQARDRIHAEWDAGHTRTLLVLPTGTGKTVTLRRMAEAFSNQGVPVFLADVKGDLSGIVNAGADSGKVGERIAEFGLGAAWLQSFPVRFWDVFGEAGIPLRVTISEMGPMLLSRLMNLNDTQEGLLNLVFRVADDNGWHLIDLKDLRGLLKHVADHAAEYRSQYGNVSAASVGAVQRQQVDRGLHVVAMLEHRVSQRGRGVGCIVFAERIRFVVEHPVFAVMLENQISKTLEHAV